MESSSSDTSMEAIRKIIWGLTLAEAIDSNICIHCKKSIILQMQAPEQENWNHYEQDGFCPTCYQLSLLDLKPPTIIKTRRAK